MTEKRKPTTAPAPIEPAAETQSAASEVSLRDYYAARIVAAMVVSVVSRGGPAAIDAAFAQSDAMNVAFALADAALAAREA